MSFEQEKMIVGSLPSLYPLQKFEEEAINALASLPIDDDTISRAKAIEALDKRFDSIPMEQTSEILMLRKDLRELPPAQQPMPSNTSNALEALENVNETQSNTLDCISRQAAIDAVQNRPMMLSKEKVLLINDLEKLPPAQPVAIRLESKNMVDLPETEGSDPSQIAAQIIHDAIDNTTFAEDAYPGIKEQLHRSVEEWEKLQTVFTEIAEEYKKSCEISYINKPLAHALYEVWKKHDRSERKKNERSNMQRMQEHIQNR